MRYVETFKPLDLGSERCHNRLGFAPMNCGLIDELGYPNNDFTDFHEMYASSGMGLVFIGGVAVSASGRPSARSLVLDCQGKAMAIKNVASKIRERGAVPVLQLMHAGRQADPDEIGFQIVAPSPIRCPVIGVTPRELSVDEIGCVVRTFVRAAEYARVAGIQILELHAAHGYLIAEFLSPYTNKRTDRYGNSLAGRLRFLLEIIEAIKEIQGIHVGVRLSGDEYKPEGISVDDISMLVKEVENAGAIYVSISAGVYDTDDRIMPERALGEAVYASLGSAAKKATKLPILLAGNVTSMDTVERLLREGCADSVLMGRALLADPLFVHKAIDGRANDIQPCTMCRICKYHSRGLPHISCPHNRFLWDMLRGTIRQANARGVVIKPKRLFPKETIRKLER